MKFVDLHTHSNCSDGTLTPTQLLDYALSKGISAIALTDHNNVEGVNEFVDASKGKNIIAIRGCEFTTDYKGQELHLLGLFLDEDKLDLVREHLRKPVIAKEESTKQTILNFKNAGYDVDYDEFMEMFNTVVVKNRVHVYNYLHNKGVVGDNKQEAFDTVLKDGGPFYKSPKKLDFIETIDFIHSIGAVAVWAHPLFHVNSVKCEEILKAAEKLDGVEVYYTTYSDEDTAFMLKMCEKYHLIISGGSDFHGENKPDVQIAIGHGNLNIPYSCYEELLKRKSKNIK